MSILEGLVLLHIFVNILPAISVEESDPCYNYTALNDTWRATSNLDQSDLRCDRNLQWQGWYRMFYQGVGVTMPEACVPMRRCSTHAPLWLTSPHPRLEEGIVTRALCGHWSNDCCYFQPPSIRVKACPGNYSVYELVAPDQCSLAYCADVSSESLSTTQAPTTPQPRMYFQQRLRLTMALHRELLLPEMTQFSSQIRVRLIQMGYPDDITVRML